MSRLSKYADGARVWRDAYGQPHRVGGPAVEASNGAKYWYSHGKEQEGRTDEQADSDT